MTSYIYIYIYIYLVIFMDYVSFIYYWIEFNNIIGSMSSIRGVNTLNTPCKTVSS